jgi:hypothetical protein
MIPAGSRICESGGMRKGVEVRLDAGDRERLEAVIGSGNSPQKHVWRARIVLLSADGVGTMAIQWQTGKGKPTIWRWPLVPPYTTSPLKATHAGIELSRSAAWGWSTGCPRFCDSVSRDAMIRSCSGLNSAKGRSNAACTGGSSTWGSPGFVPGKSEMGAMGPRLLLLHAGSRAVQPKAATESSHGI